MELFRNGLKLSVTKGLDESQGSSNVPVTLAHDSSDEYADYTEQIHMKYSANGKVYKEILPYGNNVYTIHSKAMANVGSLELAVHLFKGTTELVTNQVTLEVKEAPNAVNMVDPGEHNWQQLVDQYMENKLSNYTTEKKVREILDAMYPVGSVYITTDKNNPGNFIGGTWEQFGQGRTLVGEGTGNDGSTSMSFTSGQENGSYNVCLSKENIPNYKIGDFPCIVPDSHYLWSNDGINAVNVKKEQDNREGIHPTSDNKINSNSNEFQNGWNISTNGGNKPFEIMQPYIVTYFWKRTI